MNLIERLFDRRRRAAADHLEALRWDAGSWTYGELRRRVHAVAGELASRGVRDSDRVVFLCSDTPVFVAAYLATISAGAVAIAASTRTSEEDLGHMFHESGAAAVICDGGMAGRCLNAQNLRDRQFPLIRIDELVMGAGAADFGSQLEPCPRDDGDEALWVYSSGSTSRPKGIVHAHRDFESLCRFHVDVLGIGEGDLVFCTSRTSFAYALANGLLIPLMLGACVYLHPDWATADSVARVISAHRPKAVFSVPSIYRHLLDSGHVARSRMFSCTERYVSAGEHLPELVQAQWLSRTGVPVIDVYGCSETLFLALAGAPGDTPSGSVGKPMPHVECRLRRKGESLGSESGDVGVLHLRHPHIFTRYAGLPEETEKRLAGDWFVTGDLFRRDKHGNWFHEGREDDLIKVSGRWVNLKEIEHLCASSRLASELAVIGAEDVSGVVRPALFFVPERSQKTAASLDDMRQYVKSNLDRLAQPSWIRALQRMPRTHSGKIHRHELVGMVAGRERDQI